MKAIGERNDRTRCAFRHFNLPHTSSRMPERDQSATDEVRVARYRARAEELRAVAAKLTSLEARNMVLTTAEDYERMADSIQRVIESHRPQ